VHESLGVTDLQAGHPPVLHVRMIAIGNMHGTPAARLSLIAMIEILEPVQIVQVPENARVLAIDLESVKRLVPARVASGLERGERAVAEPGKEQTRGVEAG